MADLVKLAVEPIHSERALIVGNYLVVADLHLGFEHELRKKGIIIRPQWEKMRERLVHLLEISSAASLIIVGDLKHNIPAMSWREYSGIPGFVAGLSEHSEVIIVKGNHDGGIERLLPKTEIVKSLEINGALLTHGHMNIPSADYEYIVLGHNHPCIDFRDEFGYAVRESAWIRAELNERGMELFGLNTSPKVVIAPAFNDMLPGTPFNCERRLLGPLFNKGLVDMANAEAYLLDGTALGRIKDLG
ncbi:MAG: metallophosphoesterase [Candidatus Hydrothermarchaeales archaeon]